MTSTSVPANHPRAESLKVREKLKEYYRERIVALEGLIAHGRGEAFDYLLGEKTSRPALKAIEAAAAAFLTAKKPVISINGNVAALAAEDMVRFSQATGAKIEVNLFYRSLERERAIERLLQKAGAREVFGVGEDASATIPELHSERRRVDPRGIFAADVVLVPLEDGDRTEALVLMSKRVIAVDLNPLSRTAQMASITIVDNITRAAPLLTGTAERLKQQGLTRSREILRDFNNRENVAESIALVNDRLSSLARRGKHITFGDEKLDL
jgi:4-phosphopantoate--beta-alanine ligase